MARKACTTCRAIFEGENCPHCGEKLSSDTIKGRVYIFNKDDSQIAQNMKLKDKGEFAIKIK